MTHYRPIPLALLTLSLGACASPPIRYYTLTPPLSRGDAMAPTCCKIRIRRVAVPPGMDRADIVTRSGTDQVIIHGNDAWLAPLGDEIRSALGEEINRRLATSTPAPTVLTVRDFSVWVNITRFESVPARYVAVTAEWRIQASAPPTAAPTICATTVRITVTDGMPALVHGYQQAIVQIADQVASNLQHGGDNTVSSCKAG